MKRAVFFALMLGLVIVSACGAFLPALPPRPSPVHALPVTLALDFGTFQGTYTGGLLDGLPQSHGTFFAESGWAYQGEWQSGHFHGKGKVTWEDGYVYAGEFRNDYLNGQGFEEWHGARQYEGYYQNGYYHGLGTLFNRHGDIIYSGLFYEGLLCEPEQQRAQRLHAFRAMCQSVSMEELIAACDSLELIYTEITGTVFSVNTSPGLAPTTSDFLLSPDGQAAGALVRVIYTLSENEAAPRIGQTVTVLGSTGSLSVPFSNGGEPLAVPLLHAVDVQCADGDDLQIAPLSLHAA